MSNRPLIVWPDGRAYHQGTPDFANPGLFGAPDGTVFAMVGEMSPLEGALATPYQLGQLTPETAFSYVGQDNVAGGYTTNYGG